MERCVKRGMKLLSSDLYYPECMEHVYIVGKALAILKRSPHLESNLTEPDIFNCQIKITAFGMKWKAWKEFLDLKNRWQ